MPGQSRSGNRKLLSVQRPANVTTNSPASVPRADPIATDEWSSAHTSFTRRTDNTAQTLAIKRKEAAGGRTGRFQNTHFTFNQKLRIQPSRFFKSSSLIFSFGFGGIGMGRTGHVLLYFG